MMKIEIPSFDGSLDFESFLDWIFQVEEFYNMAYASEETIVKLVANKFKGEAKAWWNLVQDDRRRQGKVPIKS